MQVISFKLKFKTSDEDKKTRLTNAKEISVDATVAAVSSRLGGIFTLKEDKGRH